MQNYGLAAGLGHKARGDNVSRMDLRAKGRRPQDVQMVYEKVRAQEQVVHVGAPVVRSVCRKADAFNGQYSHGPWRGSLTTLGDHSNFCR